MRRVMRRATVPRGTRHDAHFAVDALTVVLTLVTCPKESMVAPMSSWASPTTGFQLVTYDCSTTRCWEWETLPCVWGWAVGHGREDGV